MAADRMDEVFSALDALSDAIERNRADEEQLLRRLSNLRRAWAEGGVVGEALAGEPVPGTLQLLGRILSRLTEGSGNARRALARAMRAEGATIPAIAQAFGVTHQRVSNILSRTASGSDAAVGKSEHESVFAGRSRRAQAVSDPDDGQSERKQLS